jgi:thiamine pyrophosphate-dependent acetolactate synthase large subunit-like protein
VISLTSGQAMARALKAEGIEVVLGIVARSGVPRRAFAALLGAPVIATVHGRGVVADDDALSLGDGWSRLDFFDELPPEKQSCATAMIPTTWLVVSASPG